MRKQKPENKQFLTAKEAARYLRMPLSTFYRLSKRGVIKGIRLGGKWTYRFQDIDYFRKNGTMDSDTNLDVGATCPSEDRTWGVVPTVPKSIDVNSDKRIFPRINTRIKASVVFSLDNSRHEGEIRDIGEGGLQFVIPYPNGLIVNDPVELKFTLDEPDEASINVKGRVVHVSEKGIGIKFRHLDKANKEEIARYVG